MIFRPFAPKDLEDLEHADLEALIVPEPIREGLVLEYKSAWEPRKIARAVASFANSPGGGTVIVGVKADKLIPTGVVGDELGPGDLEEAAVNVIRTSIAPTPSFRLRGIPIDGRACLVIEVPAGRQPPYILIRTGQILERTATSSEPVPIHNRETLDRLYRLGEQGQFWAREESWRQRTEIATRSGVAAVWTVPAVAGGLGANAVVFRRATVEAMRGLIPSTVASWAGVQHAVPRMRPDTVEITVRDDSGEGGSVRVSTTGVIGTFWVWPERNPWPGNRMLENLAEEQLPRQAEFLETQLGHLGTVVVGVFARWRQESGNSVRAEATSEPEPLDRVGSEEFLGSLRRALRRSFGSLEFEPE